MGRRSSSPADAARQVESGTRMARPPVLSKSGDRPAVPPLPPGAAGGFCFCGASARGSETGVRETNVDGRLADRRAPGIESETTQRGPTASAGAVRLRSANPTTMLGVQRRASSPATGAALPCQRASTAGRRSPLGLCLQRGAAAALSRARGGGGNGPCPALRPVASKRAAPVSPSAATIEEI